MRNGIKYLLSFLLTSCVSISLMAQTPVLAVDGGKIMGVSGTTPDVCVYKGIPYAAPPVGSLRWKQPQPVLPWQGIRLCDKFGAVSWQPGQQEGSFYWKEFYQGEQPEMSEDCLYLNVWTPAAGSTRRLPVVVWIHGGAYMNGYGHEVEFDGEAYARKGVILVTVNYRLGMCGFMAHPLLSAENGRHISGNYGLFDQLAALQWVKRNIAAFGGDADNITVMGQSAGAGSVQALVSSPLSEGLIHRAIIQSGGGLGGIIRVQALKEAEQLGKAIWDEMGINSLEDMRSYPAEKLLDVLRNYQMKKRMYGLLLAPCIDGWLLPEEPDEVARSGNALDIPYLIGYTSEDINPAVMKQAAIDWSLLMERRKGKPAYVYCFSRDLPGEDMEPNPLLGGFGDMKGAFHSAELWYMFGTLGRCWRPMESVDYQLSERMVSYWTNFARNGNPNGAGLPEWQPCTAGHSVVLKLDIE